LDAITLAEIVPSVEPGATFGFCGSEVGLPNVNHQYLTRWKDYQVVSEICQIDPVDCLAVQLCKLDHSLVHPWGRIP